MSAADVPPVAAIEAVSSAAPWTEEIFRSCLRPEYLCRVLESRGELIGFAIANQAAGEGHLLNLAVRPAERRHGFGRQLLAALITHYRRHAVDTVFLEVRSSNVAAIALYRGVGFASIGVRPDYYARGDGREDAITMRLDLYR